MAEKLQRAHVSDIDKFLNKLTETTPLSESQQQEIDKHARIAKARDEAGDPAVDNTIWEDF